MRYQEGGDQVLDVAVVSVSTDTSLDCTFDSDYSIVCSAVLSIFHPTVHSAAPLAPRTKPTGPFLVSAIHPPPTNNSQITASLPVSIAV